MTVYEIGGGESNLTNPQITGKLYLDYSTNTYLEYVGTEVVLYVGGNIAASW